EALTRMPPNVEPLRPLVRPAQLGSFNAIRQSSGGPTPAAVAVTAVLRAQPRPVLEEVAAFAPEPQPVRQPVSPIEPLILGNQETPSIEEEEIPPMPAFTRAQPMREALAEAKPEPKRRRFFGGWSERKPEVRTEPAP